MAVTNVYRALGPTVAISVSTTSGPVVNGVSLFPGTNENCNYLSFLNIGSTSAFVSVGASGAQSLTAVAPTSIAASNIIPLPPTMTAPLVYSAGQAPFSVSVVGSGPTVVLVTPVQAG